jgi:hypothetical protein
VREHPILFSGPMVQALLAGTKTQTRRMMKPQPTRASTGTWFWSPNKNVHHVGDDGMFQIVVSAMSCPYGWVGDRLWVKETFCPTDAGFAYRASTDADGERCRRELGLKWKPSIFCTRKASRITLEITAVRVERLNVISEADALAEGCAIDKGHVYAVAGAEHFGHRTAVGCYQTLWANINGAGSWDVNPWVWVIEFRRVQA